MKIGINLNFDRLPSSIIHVLAQLGVTENKNMNQNWGKLVNIITASTKQSENGYKISCTYTLNGTFPPISKSIIYEN